MGNACTTVVPVSPCRPINLNGMIIQDIGTTLGEGVFGGRVGQSGACAGIGDWSCPETLVETFEWRLTGTSGWQSVVITSAEGRNLEATTLDKPVPLPTRES